MLKCSSNSIILLRRSGDLHPEISDDQDSSCCSTLPPKGHNLISLLQKSGVAYDEKTGVFLAMLNEVDVKTRYPDNLDRLIEQYPEKNVAEVLNKAKEALEWIKAQF
ncbi:MAG: HEPN domain-containing protein [Candidatus Xenobiia bacterium LiM19]